VGMISGVLVRGFALVMVLRCTHTWLNGEGHGVMNEPKDRPEWTL
jgi:hypothetical protein